MSLVYCYLCCGVHGAIILRKRPIKNPKAQIRFSKKTKNTNETIQGVISEETIWGSGVTCR